MLTLLAYLGDYLASTPESTKNLKDKGNDELISIDLGKIKKFFSELHLPDEDKKDDQPKKEAASKPAPEQIQQQPKQPTQPQQTPPQRDADDEEFSFSIEKIKKAFGSAKQLFSSKSEKEANHDEQEEGLDLKQVKKFIIAKHKAIVIIVLLSIAIFMSVHLRSMPAYLPVTDDWAENSINNQILNEIRGEVAGDYPNLPDANRDEIVNAEFAAYLKENKAEYEGKKQQLSEFYKSRLQNENGNTYLIAIDPYFWMRNAANIIDHGFPGDVKINGIQIDNHMIAPLGREEPPDMFHAYFGAFLFKLVSFFNKNVDLMAVAFSLPIILSALAVIPAFFIARRVGGNFAGFIAAFLVAIHPAFLTRTVGGFSDTDAYNVLFPLFITWLFLEAFETEKFKKRIMLSGLAGLLMGMYSIAWGGWWYIFDFLIATSGLYLLYYVIIHFKKLRSFKAIIRHKPIINTVTLIAVFVIVSAFSVSFFFTFTDFLVAPFQPLNFASIKDVATTTVWPNVFTTVAEQNEASYEQIINQIGGKFLFYLAILGIILAIIKKDIHGKHDVKVSILLTLWFSSTIYASTKGVRWTLLLVPAFAIALGVCIGIVFNFLVTWGKKELSINKWLSGIVLVILFLLLLGVTPIPPFCTTGLCSTAFNTARAEIPSMNDAWWLSLTRIKEDSEPDAIITSWWDFGHWFKFVADRPVTFDGTSQGTPMAYWVGKALLTDNETKAIGILRMLDCKSNEAFEELNTVIQKPHQSIDLLNEIIVVGKEEARAILKREGLAEEQQTAVLANTHCDPPQAYVITSDDMIGKSGVWGHFGSWNFDRATMFNRIRKMTTSEATSFLKEEFNVTGDAAQSIISEIKSLGVGRDANDWIAPWPSYNSNIDGCNKITNDTFHCLFQDVVAQINITTMTAFIDTNQGEKHLASLLVKDGETLRYQEYDNHIGVGMILIREGESFNRVVASPPQVNSMFTRLFFLDGTGLKHFTKFSDERSVFGQRIIVWKVDWEGKEAVIIEEEEEMLDEEEVLEEKDTVLEGEEGVLDEEEEVIDEKEDLVLEADSPNESDAQEENETAG